MGYDLHITRKKLWFDKGDDISEDEWLCYVKSDKELKIKTESGACFTNWSGECSYGKGTAWFDWNQGNIYTKNPDNFILKKMLLMAKVFNAKVQGDDGEVYDVPDLTKGHEE